jgi:hypothetical protein
MALICRRMFSVLNLILEDVSEGATLMYKYIIFIFKSFLPLGATAQGELRPPEQSAAIRITC